MPDVKSLTCEKCMYIIQTFELLPTPRCRKFKGPVLGAGVALDEFISACPDYCDAEMFQNRLNKETNHAD